MAPGKAGTSAGRTGTGQPSGPSGNPVVAPRKTPLSFVPAYPDEPQPATLTTAAPAEANGAGDACPTPSRRRALVTGATSGIGLELARVLAAEGHDLILVARTKKTLDRVAAELRDRHGVVVGVLAVDLADARAPHVVAENVRRGGEKLHVLVNNAGCGVYGAFADTPLEDELDMLQLNIAAVTSLTKLLLPFVRAGRGRVLNVASTAAFQPGPFMAAYYGARPTCCTSARRSPLS